MSVFRHRGGELFVEDVAVARIAAAVGTPAYVYSSAAMERAYLDYLDALEGLDATICYALKANSNLAVIRTFSGLGAGADVVSGGELAQALAAGVPGNRIVFAGVGKTRAEMAAGLDAGIMEFNVESDGELRALSELATSRGVTAPVALRVNPDVDAATHDKISTGRMQDKFGIPWERAAEVYRLAAKLPGIAVEGIAVHIGSQLTSLEPFRAAFTRMAELARRLRAEGVGLRRLDLGGGLGIDYAGESPPSPREYAQVVRETVGDLGLSLVLEPGRSLVGNAGLLLARVIYVKDDTKRFVILDAAMNDLIRPTLYDAWHDVVAVREPGPDAAMGPADFVGPICETGDILAVAREAPPLAPDDLIAFRSAGAYARVMASNYNSRPMAPEVLVRGDDFALVRPRQRLEALWEEDRLPPWLAPASDAERGAA